MHQAEAEFDHICNFRCGLETNCSSGKMGTEADRVNITTLKKKVGDSWSFAPDDHYQLFEYNPQYGYSAPIAYGDWGAAPGQNLWNYRNDTAP